MCVHKEYMCVHKEALLSSQIEGTQSLLSDLLLYETAKPGVPYHIPEDVEEVSCHVSALARSGAVSRKRTRGPAGPPVGMVAFVSTPGRLFPATLEMR